MYFKLLKVYLRDFSLDRLFKVNGSKGKKIAIYALILYGTVVLLGSFGFMFFNLADILNDMNQIHVMISFLAMYSLGLPIIMALFRASGTLFFYKDYDIVAPLPIKPRTVFAAKLTVMFIWMYIINFIFVLPILFSYFYFAGFNIVSLLIYLLFSVVFPIVPIVVMTFFSLGIGYIATKFSFGKIIQIILLFILFFGIMVLQFSLMGDGEVNPLTGQIDVIAGITKYYPPIGWYQHAISDHNILEFLYLVLSHVFLLIAFIFGVEKISTALNQKGIQKHRNKKVKATKIAQRSVTSIIIKKEFNKFFSIPIYALNAGFGLVILLVLSIASLFVDDITSVFATLEIANLEPFVAVALIIGFVVSLAYTPAITLSLEGKNFWIIKSLPIKAERVMLSKILFNIVLALPVIFISIFIFMFSIHIAPFLALVLFVLSASLLVLVSFIDSVINLYFPKFDYKNEVEVVKQSAGALIGMLLGMTVVVINAVIYYFLIDYMVPELLMLLLSLMNILLVIPFYDIIKRKSEKIFLKL